MTAHQHRFRMNATTFLGDARAVLRRAIELGVDHIDTSHDRMLLIPGTSSVTHLEANMAATGLELDDDDLAALDRVEPRDDRAA
jgi:pyridoxine 4-dehydrogenase